MSARPQKHNLFFIKKNEAKKSDVWNDIVNQRLHDQHPGEMSENDQHAIPKMLNPVVDAALEQKGHEGDSLSNIESQIHHLRSEERKKHSSPQPAHNPHRVQDDEWYDD